MQISKNILKSSILTLTLLITIQANAMSPSDLNSYVTDAAATASIRSKILMDHSLSNLKIDVSTTNGVVNLDGKLATDAEATQLVEIATDTSGVKDVDATKLSVDNNEQPLSDLIITAKIKGLFVRYKLFSSIETTTIKVETKNAIVYLTGTANDEKQADLAGDIAGSIRGVDKVNSSIQVK